MKGHAALGDVRTGSARVAEAKAEYEKALALDPKLSEARIALAIVLARTGDPVGARNVLEQGMAYTYLDGPELIQYYQMTAQIRMQTGDPQGAVQLASQVKEIEERIRRRR